MSSSVLSNVSLGQIVLTTIVAFFVYNLLRAFHNAFFHPLANIPGPKLRASFHFPYYYELCKGNSIYNWQELHEKYGDLVRVSPDTVSAINPGAWRDIYGHANKLPMQKDPVFYYRSEGQAADIISCSDAEHTRIRRLLNNAFSERALQSQEEMINKYITLMITKLHKRAAANQPVDIMKYFNFTTFDITGDLMFDESFGSLETEEYDAWIANIFKSLRIGQYMFALEKYGIPVVKIIESIPALAGDLEKHENYSKDKAARRLKKDTDRKDFISYILKHNDERGMTHAEIGQTSGTFVIGGSETSATLLSGATYYLLKNPEWLAKLNDEIRSSFASESEISFTPLSQLKILDAILHETFRIYPPVPSSLPHVSPPGGASVTGTYIAAETRIGIPQYVANHSSRNFTDPDKFAPERFLGDSRYANDKRSVVQPFSTGPRNCIGQSLAWAELRTILARCGWHFDCEAVDTSDRWEKQKVFVLWDKPSLMVKLKARNTTGAA